MSTITSCEKISWTKSRNLSTNDATSMSSTRTSFGEIPPPNISKSSHGPNATDSSSTNVSLTRTLYCHFHTDAPPQGHIVKILILGNFLSKIIFLKRYFLFYLIWRTGSVTSRVLAPCAILDMLMKQSGSLIGRDPSRDFFLLPDWLGSR